MKKPMSIHISMKVLSVDMKCEMCVKRVTKALNEQGLDFTVSLNDKTVTVNGSDDDVQKAVKALDAIGFEAK